MIRVGLIAAKMAARWPKSAPPDTSLQDNEMGLETSQNQPVQRQPSPPEEITAAVAAAEKRYRKSHRRRVCLEDPSGCLYERNVESLRQ